MNADELKVRTKTFALRVMEGHVLPESKVRDLHQEADEIAAIMTASHKTAQKNR